MHRSERCRYTVPGRAMLVPHRLAIGSYPSVCVDFRPSCAGLFRSLPVVSVMPAMHLARWVFRAFRADHGRRIGRTISPALCSFPSRDHRPPRFADFPASRFVATALQSCHTSYCIFNPFSAYFYRK